MAATATKRRQSPQEIAVKRVAAGKCITCDNKPQTRGLCFRCNQQAKASIVRGETTDLDLISKGLILPPKRRGRVVESGFVKALARAKGGAA